MYKGDPRGITPIHRPTEDELRAVVDKLTYRKYRSGPEVWVAIVDDCTFYLSPEAAPVEEAGK